MITQLRQTNKFKIEFTENDWGNLVNTAVDWFNANHPPIDFDNDTVMQIHSVNVYLMNLLKDVPGIEINNVYPVIGLRFIARYFCFQLINTTDPSKVMELLNIKS